MVSKKSMSQCISKDYCKGWNDCVSKMRNDNKQNCHYSVVEDIHSDEIYTEFGFCSVCKTLIFADSTYCHHCGCKIY